MSEVAFKSFSKHLWYLSEPLVAFSFFDERVDDNEKLKMVEALSRKSSLNYKRKISIVRKEVSNKTISDFVTENTLKFMIDYGLNVEWLSQHPQTWNNHPGFRESKNIVNHLLVVNDCAERAIKLIQEFSGHLTKNEQDLPALLQTVESSLKEMNKNFTRKDALKKKIVLSNESGINSKSLSANVSEGKNMVEY